MTTKSVTDLCQDLVDHLHRAQTLREETSSSQANPEEVQAASSMLSDSLNNYRSYAIYLRLNQDDNMGDVLSADAPQGTPEDTPYMDDAALSDWSQSEHSEHTTISQTEYLIDPIVSSSNNFHLTDPGTNSVTQNTPFDHIYVDPAIPTQSPIPQASITPHLLPFNPSSRTSNSPASHIDHDLGRLTERGSRTLRVINVTDPDTFHHNTLRDSYSEIDMGHIGGPLYVANNLSIMTLGGSECAASEFECTGPRHHLSTSRRVNASDVAQRLVLGTPHALVRQVTVLGIGLLRGGGRALRWGRKTMGLWRGKEYC